MPNLANSEPYRWHPNLLHVPSLDVGFAWSHYPVTKGHFDDPPPPVTHLYFAHKIRIKYTASCSGHTVSGNEIFAMEEAAPGDPKRGFEDTWSGSSLLHYNGINEAYRDEDNSFVENGGGVSLMVILNRSSLFDPDTSGWHPQISVEVGGFKRDGFDFPKRRSLSTYEEGAKDNSFSVTLQGYPIPMYAETVIEDGAPEISGSVELTVIEWLKPN